MIEVAITKIKNNDDLISGTMTKSSTT